MKNEINLLPPGAAKARVVSLYIKQVGHLLRLIVVVMFLIAGIPLLSVFLSENLKKSVVSNLTLEEEQQVLKKDLGTANQTLLAIEQRIDGSEIASAKFKEILEVMPSQMTLSSLSFKADDKSIVIKGKSADRALVNEYKTSLEILEGVNKVSAPLSNLETSTDASFSLEVHYATADQK